METEGRIMKCIHPNHRMTMPSPPTWSVRLFMVLLKDKSCCIRDSKGHQIGRIPQYHSLYCIDEGFPVLIQEFKCIHTLDELHWKMGHISHAITKCLVEQKIVLGLELDTKYEPTFCTSCAKARPTTVPSDFFWPH